MPLTRTLAVVAPALVAATLGAAALIAGPNSINPASAEDWPTHPLTLVVPWAAGGGTVCDGPDHGAPDVRDPGAAGCC